MARLGIFPVSFKVRGKQILIIGGGVEALAKARLAVKTDARVRVVASEIAADFTGLDVELAERRFAERDLSDTALVFIADAGPDNTYAAERAREHGIPVNVVDTPEECDFFTPAIVDRAPISVAISSEGDAPVLARLIRARIEALLPLHLGALAGLAGRMRDRVMAALPGGDDRRHYFEALLTSGRVEHALEAGDDAAAESAAEALLDAQDAGAGSVWLVGAGPGTEDLLTLRAQRVLQGADVIVHDQLVSDEVVQMGRRDAERIAVGKVKGAHSFTQKRINDLIIRLAREGQRVVRLKSGDPMVFGRAGEEVAALRKAGIGYSIVPGVTAALAAAADTATPVTLRKVSSGFVFATAHGANDDELAHWAALAHSGVTLGIYMSKSVAGRTASALIGEGLSPALPVGIVVNAGRADRKTYYGALGDLTGGHKAFAEGPALILIGAAVAEGDWQQAEALIDRAAKELVA